MTNTATVRQVIRYLGIVTLLLVLGVMYLIHDVLSKKTITPEDVAILTPLVGLAGTGLGSLGTLLAHTGSVDPAPTPEQATDLESDPDAGQAEVRGVLTMAATIALGLITWSVIGAHTHLY